MFDEPARGWSPSELGRSPLIDDVHPTAPNPWIEFLQVLGSGLVGLVGGGVAALGVGVVAFFLVVMIIASTGGDPASTLSMLDKMQSGAPPESLGTVIGALGFLALLNTIMMVLFVLLAGLLRRRRLRDSITAAPRFRWGQLLVGLMLNAAALGGLLAVESQFAGEELTWPLLALTNSASEIVLMVVTVTAAFIVAAFAEEILFRGWLLRESAAFTRNAIILLLINGVLFSAIHVNPLTWQLDPNAFIARTVMGMAFCYMALRFGGIEFATGAHAANNIMLTLIVEPLTLAEPPPEPVQAGLMLESVVLMAIGVMITELAARAPFLRGLMGPPLTSPAERYSAVDTFR